MKFCIYKSKFLNLWVCKNNEKLLDINKHEEKIAKSMNSQKSRQYIFSRGYVRFCLGQLFKLHPLKVPLVSEPGKPPRLKNDLGFLSFSHTKDALAISWSNERVGVDIERIDRKLKSPSLLRDFLDSERHFMSYKNNNEKIRSQILNIWVIKEALIKRECNSLANGFKNWDIDIQFLFAKNIITNEEVLTKKIIYEDWIIGLASNQINGL
tara:strand:- start:265 stop:894 length:630 start_codon:yes stop_codon:yes gene_type:complete